MRPASTSRISRRSAVALFVGALVACVVACKSSDAAAEPVWGKEPCAHCKMLVGDKRYAAQVMDESGEHRFFDDIGCMVLWTNAHNATQRAWAHDSTGSAWLEARSARYVQGARTPMDFGFEARSEQGEIGFEAVRAAVLEKKRSSR